MRSLPQSLADRLGGATTLCHCWRLLLRDGTRLGFTDHDRDLVIDGLVHAAGTALDASEVETNLGFAVGGGEVTGALSAAALSESDLARGRYDAATLETWLVDWMQTDARVLLDVGVIGEVRRSDMAFSAEVRSLAHAFDEPRGKLFQLTCSAELGDVRCRAVVDSATFRTIGPVMGHDGAATIVVDAGQFEAGWFSGGSLFAAGQRIGTIRDHAVRDGQARITLWTPPPALPATGSMVTLVAGCDKSFETCRTKFANQVNFRGFPHMPGNELALTYVKAGEINMDGGSLFK